MVELEERVIEAVRDEITTDIERREPPLEPVFYAITGSHCYGTSGPDSDLDVRGFHCAEGIRYALSEPPAEQLEFVRRMRVDGVGEFDLDLVSFELRKFAALVRAGNFTVVEFVCEGPVVLDWAPGRVAALRSLIRSQSTPAVARSYLGMARGTYERDVRGDETRPTVDRFLYVLRGALGAKHVREHGSVEPRLDRLAETVSSDPDLIGDLVALKRAHGDVAPSPDLERRATDAIRRELADLDDERRSTGPEPELRADVDEWMIATRRETGTLLGAVGRKSGADDRR
ncbi:nucleotidyltransferase domain-containing protein [Natrarchaeobius oligotrophus]|nr:nucleotidyltransferase domain-containing protein [Natrarchaeobius chitinivorans]